MFYLNLLALEIILYYLSIFKINEFCLLVNYRDRYCGKLICKYKKEKVLDIPNATVIYSNVNGHICISLEYSHNHEESAKMWVKDGTICGPSKVCSLLFPDDFLMFYILFLNAYLAFFS